MGIFSMVTSIFSSKKSNMLTIILSSIIALLLLALHIGNNHINQLEKDIELKTLQKAQADMQIIGLTSSITSQNKEIEKYQTDLASKKKVYEKLLKSKNKIRYKTIYKTIPNIGVNSDECKDIKKLLDSIRTNGFN